jgi:DNA invertase Pin-like site-specific DNA recombinase
MRTTNRPWAIYLRLSDFRGDPDGFEPREARLREEVARLGGTVAEPPVIENDLPKANGRSRPASAFKRVPVRDKAGEVVRDPDTGKPVMRVHRPRWQEQVIAPIKTGRVAGVVAEDLDRVARDPRDLEDLVDACAASGGSARSLSGSLTLTSGGTDAEVTMARMMVAMAWKASADNRRRVSAKRADLAADGSYGGGRRPFGYRPDPDAPKYHKRLLIVPEEADEIRAAAAAIMARVSLAAVARDWRERGVPSVTGAKWTASGVRGVLAKPAVAGLVVTHQDGQRVLRPGNWPAVLKRDRWEALMARLAEPTMVLNGTVVPRKTSTGNEPKHLCSLWARCGRCGAPVVAGGGGGGRRYLCSAVPHLGRLSAAVDAMVAAHVIARLERPDAAHLLAPPARLGVDAHALRAEQARLTALAERQAAMWTAGEVTDAEMRAASAERKRRLDAIAAALTATSEPDPLAEFRGQPDARTVWEGLSLPRKREVARLLCRVTLLPATRRGHAFDPGSVRVEPAV